MFKGATLLSLVLAFVSGVSMAVQGSANSLISKNVGLFKTSFLVLLGGAIMCGAILLFGLDKIGGLENGSFSNLSKVPWIAYISIPLGIVITWTVAYSISKSGAVMATTSILVGQVITAAVIDTFGLLGVEKVPFAMYKVLGIVLLGVGAYILLK